MNKFFDIKNAYFDLDGTIVPENKNISDKTIKALKYLQSKKIKIGLATGRSYFFTKPIINLIGFDLPTICINGALIIDLKHNIIKAEYFPKTAYSLLDTLYKKKIKFLIYADDGVFFNDKSHPFYARLLNMGKLLDINFNFAYQEIKEIDFYKNKNFYKILAVYENQNDKKQMISFLKSFTDLSFASSQNTVMDIFNNKVDKSLGIKYIAETQNINLEQILVFGDNENDIKMFQMFNNSVVLKNAKDYVKKTAKYITKFDCKNDGVADFILRNF